MGTMAPSKKIATYTKTYWLSVISFISIFVVNTLGFADTVTGSAMGCGRDWPLCNGQMIPSYWNSAVVIEYVHRLSVVVGGGLLLTLAVTAWITHGAVRYVRMLIVLSLLGVVLEGGLGALAVMFVNPPAVMAAHMGIALLSFVGVYLLVFVIGGADKRRFRTDSEGPSEPLAPDVLQRFSHAVWWSIPYAYMAIYVGAYVANTGYGGSFQGWPFPTEAYVLSGPAFWVDILHRTVALGFLVWMISLVRMSRRFRTVRPRLYRTSCLALVLVSLQAVSGGLLIATHLSVYAFLIHVTIVSFLFATQSHLGLQVHAERQLGRLRTPRVQMARHDAELSRTARPS